MDVTDIIATLEAANQANNPGFWISTAVGFVLAFGWFIYGMRKHVAWDRQGNDSRALLWAGFGFLGLIVGLGFGITLGYVLMPDTDMGNESAAMASVSDRIEETYGVEVSPERVMSAWIAADDEVVSFVAMHEGADKSLGIRFDKEDSTVVVYQGNVVLEPLKQKG